jgi:DNA-binding transcriptional regulator GbsR (MarR family)
MQTLAFNTAASSTEGDGVESLSELDTEFIDLFVRMAQLVGLPKSFGQIYGLIYATPAPLNLEDVMLRLGISKGSASQGLRFLRSSGAVRVVAIPGRRSDHYEAETSLRKLVSGFLKEQIDPHLDSGLRRLSRLRELSADVDPGDRDLIQDRIGRLENWHHRAGAILPFVLRFLGR